MKTVKRQGVFETNSSSCHSISIFGGNYIKDILPVDDNGVCEIYDGEFGWEEDSFSSAAVKASYCLTYASRFTENEEPNNEYLEMLKEVIKENTGCTEVVFNIGDGYIDHQSDDVCGEAFENKQALTDFIFNKKSYLLTDNDNH